VSWGSEPNHRRKLKSRYGGKPVIAKIKSPVFGWIRFTVPMRVTDFHLRKRKPVPLSNFFDNGALDEHSVLKTAAPGGIFVVFNKIVIDCEKIHCWAQRFMYTVARSGHKDPPFTASILNNIVFEVPGTLRPIQMGEQGFPPSGQITELLRGARIHNCSGAGWWVKLRAVAAIVTCFVTATAATYKSAGLDVVSAISTMRACHEYTPECLFITEYP
jgi:hypothetical protein